MYFLVSYEIIDSGEKRVAYGEEVLSQHFSGELPKEILNYLDELNERGAISVTLPPEKAYGRVDKSKIKSLPLKEFLLNGVRPFPGLIVEINGKRAKILSVSRGRVTVDFNHILAGKTLKFLIKLEKKLENLQDLVKELARLRNLPPEKIELSGEDLVVEEEVWNTSREVLQNIAEDIKRYTGRNVKVMLRGERDGEYDKGGSGEGGKGR